MYERDRQQMQYDLERHQRMLAAEAARAAREAEAARRRAQQGS